MAQNNSPIITASVIDINEKTVALTGDNRKLIKSASTAYASMSAVAQGGASIDQDLYVIRNVYRFGYSTSHTFDNVTFNVFTFSAQDSNGNIGTARVETAWVEYIPLSCDMVSTRPDTSGHMDVQCTGTCFNGSFGAVTNSLTVYFQYTLQGTENWSDGVYMNIVQNGNTFRAYASFTIPNYDYKKSYVFRCVAEDKLQRWTSLPLPTISTPVFHWGESDFVFEVPVNMKGDLRLKGEGNYGNTLRFGDSDYCYLAEKTDDELTIHASAIALEGSVSVNGSSFPAVTSGEWYPMLNDSAISYYTAQEGWYSKVGQTVTIGFYIKAYCNSGYDSISIAIGGLPFTPMYSAAGGGMCSGAYVGGGYTFQCFVVGTNGTITTRVQACDNDAANNLATSASGCNYRYGGGEITLSGTITFLTGS